MSYCFVFTILRQQLLSSQSNIEAFWVGFLFFNVTLENTNRPIFFLAEKVDNLKKEAKGVGVRRGLLFVGSAQTILRAATLR